MVVRLVEIHGSVIDLRYGARVGGGHLVVYCILGYVLNKIDESIVNGLLTKFSIVSLDH